MTARFDDQREVAQARASVYRFLTRLYGGPPTAELLSAVAGLDFHKLLEAVFGEATQPFLDAVAAGPDPEALRLEYDALFRVPGDWYLRPFESVYRGRQVVDGQVVDGTVWGRWTKEVQRLYALAGAELAGGAGELPDFIAVELDFMAFLCTREAEALAAGDGELARHFLALQKEFLVEHLSRWVDTLGDEMRAMARSGFYAGLAEMTQAFVSADCVQVQAAWSAGVTGT
ncbi:MAG: molecular chaperone [Anaerolineae bacterium]